MMAEGRSAAHGPVSILAVTATAKTRSRDHGLAAWNRALSSYNLRQVQSLYFYKTDRLHLLLWLCLKSAYAPSVLLCTASDFVFIHCESVVCNTVVADTYLVDRYITLLLQMQMFYVYSTVIADTF